MWRRWRVRGQQDEAKTCLDGLQAKGCWALFTRAKVHSDQLGQSVPDVVNDTLLDPDLTRALCILHYQTLGSLKLHYLHRSSPPSRRERGARGQHLSWPKLRNRGYFSLQVRLLHRRLHITQLAFLYPLVALFLRWEPVRCNNSTVSAGTPRTILPTGIFGEIWETHRSQLIPPASLMNELCCVDVRIINKCNLV